MNPNESSLISGLDLEALFSLAADSSGDSHSGWQAPSLSEVAVWFPNWEALRVLGRGGMGVVYHFRQPELDRQVAVKLLPMELSRDERAVERFRREARVLAKLRHPGIVGLHDAGITAAGHPYLVMEYVDGVPLDQKMAEGKVDVRMAMEIVRQVCDALAYAHAAGVVHRDIKPSNLLIDQAGVVRVADFGLARWESAEVSGEMELSRSGMFLGTPAYTAPEQVRDAAHVDHRADLYSLGVLFYELLTGEVPRGVFQPPSKKVGSDVRLDEVIQRALQERPEDRYQAAQEFKKEVTAEKPFTAGVGWKWVAGFLVSGVAGWYGWREMSQRPQVQTPEVARMSEKSAPAIASEVPRHAPVKEGPQVELAAVNRVKEPPTLPPVQKLGGKSVARCWSLTPVEPTLSPPDGLMKRSWRDAELIANGGVVLLEGGKQLVAWSKSRFGERPLIELSVPVRQLAHTAEKILVLDEEGVLWSLDPAEDRLRREMDHVQVVFSSEHPERYAWRANSGEGRIGLLGGADSGVVSGMVQALAITRSGLVWAVDANGILSGAKQDSRSFEALEVAGDGVYARLRSGEWLGFGEVASVPDEVRRANWVKAAAGLGVAGDASGRLWVWGAGVEDGLQRMRMPEGTKQLRVSPRGLFVAW